MSGLKLYLTLAQLQKLCLSAIVEEAPEPDPTPDNTLLDDLDSVIAILKSRVKSLRVWLSFSDYLVCKASLALAALVLGCW